MAERGLEQWDATLADLGQALEIYLSLGDRKMIGESFTELTDAFIWAGRFHEATETALRGLAYLQADVSADRARLLAALGHVRAATGNYEPAHEALREALSIASQVSDPKLMTRLIGARSVVNFHFLRLREAGADGILSTQTGASEAPPWQRALQLRILQQTLLYLGRPEEAFRIADQLEPLARKIGQTYSIALCLSMRDWAEFGKAPDLAELEASVRQQADARSLRGDVSNSDQKVWFAFWQALSEVQLAVIDFFRGNWADALVHARASCRPNRPEPGGSIEGFGAGMLFRQMAYAGDRDGALALLHEKRTSLPAGGQPNTRGSWLMLALVIEGLAVLGEQSQAGELYTLARELIDTGAVAFWAFFRLTHTIAGVAAAAARQWKAAEDHFQIAMQQAEAFPQRLEQAEIRRFHAMMLMDRAAPGDRDKAQTLLGEALESYTQIGMPRHIEMTRTLLASARTVKAPLA
jgi:tetratricopeptide (TPR) repeat protein